LCGANAAKRVVLVTTMWDKTIPAPASESLPKKSIDILEGREKELKNNRDWANLFKRGARTHRFDNEKETAWSIIKLLLAEDNNQTALPDPSPDELRELNKRLSITDTGGQLFQQLQTSLDQRIKTTDPGQKARINENIKETVVEIRRLKLPWTTRLKKWLFGR